MSLPTAMGGYTQGVRWMGERERPHLEPHFSNALRSLFLLDQHGLRDDKSQLREHF